MNFFNLILRKLTFLYSEKLTCIFCISVQPGSDSKSCIHKASFREPQQALISPQTIRGAQLPNLLASASPSAIIPSKSHWQKKNGAKSWWSQRSLPQRGPGVPMSGRDPGHSKGHQHYPCEDFASTRESSASQLEQSQHLSARKLNMLQMMQQKNLLANFQLFNQVHSLLRTEEMLNIFSAFQSFRKGLHPYIELGPKTYT